MKQFGTFDTLEDRRELLILIDRLGGGLPMDLANERRARWLQKLASRGMVGKAAQVIDAKRCHPTGAYLLFIQIVGVLGVRIEDAARELEEEVRRQ